MRDASGMTQGSKIGKGVRQGCRMSPTLFGIYLEVITKHIISDGHGINV